MENITNDKVTAYIDSLFLPASKEFEALRDHAELNNIPILQRESEGFLRSILKMYKPKNILEIGTAIGYSSSIMAKTCQDARVLSLEKSEDMYEAAISNIDKLGFGDRIEVRLCDAREELNSLKNQVKAGQREKFDLVFVDAAKSHYTRFWIQAVQMVKAGGVVICDNVLQRGMTVDDCYDPNDKHRTNIRKMRDFLEYITSLDYAHTSIIAVGDGISISYIEKPLEM